MTRIINNLTRSAGRLLLTIALTAAVTSFVSCTKDNGDTNLGGNPAATTLTVANLPGFGDANTTRTNASTRALNPNSPIGTPDVGKTTWEEEDQLAILVIFYADQTGQEIIGRTRAYATYKGGKWVLGDGLTTVTGDKNMPHGVAGGKVVWPINAKAMVLYAGYAPGQTIDASGNLCTTRPEDAGKREIWGAFTHLITTPGAPIVFEKWDAQCARVRVAAAPGDVVKFAAPGFHPTGGLSDNPLSTPVGTNFKRPGEPVGYLIATADAKGNAYFYGSSEEKTTVIISLTQSALYGNTEIPVFQNEKDFTPYAKGITYTINALDRSAMDDTYNWDDTYVGSADKLNPEKSKWVITDEEPDYMKLKDALREIASTSPTRLISIELLRVKSVEIGAFGGYTNLESISLPKVESIGINAFNGCTALQSISLPTATSIGNGAFRDCTALQSISLPKVESIGINAFNGCTALQSISLPTATSIGDEAFRDCTALQSISLPKVESIGINAFNGCEKLATIHLPIATSIMNNAFYGCKTLTTVELLAATNIGEGAFNSCTALAKVSAPVATSIDLYAFYGCEKLTTVELDAAVSIGESAFFGCAALQSITLPKAESIGMSAFYGCTSLATVTFGTPITKWGENVLGIITADITLTLAAGQKAMAWDQATRAFTTTAADFDFANSGNKFCGSSNGYDYIFKEIKQAK